MKIKDMERLIVDGTHVAVGHEYKPEEDNEARRAVIVAVRQSRRVYRGCDMGGHTATDGVRVRFVDGLVQVVGPKQIVDLWDTYLEARTDRLARARSEHDELEDRRERAERAAGAIEGAFTEPIRTRGFKTVGYRVVLSIADAEQVAERLGRIKDEVL